MEGTYVETDVEKKEKTAERIVAYQNLLNKKGKKEEEKLDDDV